MVKRYLGSWVCGLAGGFRLAAGEEGLDTSDRAAHGADSRGVLELAALLLDTQVDHLVLEVAPLGGELLVGQVVGRVRQVQLFALEKLADVASAIRMDIETRAERITLLADRYGLSDSGIGLWASGRNESGAGLAAKLLLPMATRTACSWVSLRSQPGLL